MNDDENIKTLRHSINYLLLSGKHLVFKNNCSSSGSYLRGIFFLPKCLLQL